jgi:SSS family solute:Na+ symporter
MSLLDYTIIALYLLVLLYLGFRRSRGADKSLEEFVLSGRRLSLPAFVATLVTTWYGGILGVGEFSYSYGISNWLVFGVPYYLYAVLFAFFLAGRARRQKLLTIPEQLERAYGKGASIVGAIFVFMLSTPAPYMLMLGVLCEILFAMPLWLGMCAGTLLSMIYSFRGGFAAVVRTEKLQFILMYAGFALILYFAAAKFGGFGFLKQNLPASHLAWHGGNSPLFILVWYFIAMSTLVDPTFYQRCFAAKDERTARNGILLSVLCWAIFDFMTTATGLYARAILPQLTNAVESYPRLALELLPEGARGIFYVALFAIIMSTVDGFAFTSAVTLGKDILAKASFARSAAFLLRKKKSANDSPLEGGQGGVAQHRATVQSASNVRFDKRENLSHSPLHPPAPLKGGMLSESEVTRLTRLGLVLTFIFAIAIALWARSVVAIWYQLGTIVTPALLLPLASSFSEKWRMRPRLALASMLMSAGITAVWLWNQSEGKYWWGIEPIFPGLICAAGFFLLGIKKSAKTRSS